MRKSVFRRTEINRLLKNIKCGFDTPFAIAPGYSTTRENKILEVINTKYFTSF